MLSDEPHVPVTDKDRRNELIVAADKCGFGLGVLKPNVGYWFSEDAKIDELRPHIDDEQLFEMLPSDNPVSKP